MSYDFSKLQKRGDEITEWLKTELGSLRTGRANTALVERVMVDSYGAKAPLQSVASVSVEDARTLRIAPWDKTQIGPVQQAIDKANLGVSTVPDDLGVRVVFPEMTEENRKHVVKLVKERLEEAKISLRKERDEVWNDIQKKEKDKEFAEDDKFRYKDQMEDMVKKLNETFEDMSQKKEKDISSI
ncbi:ribosome recycling factor [bacterium]|nr:ribosome recycling factor [bacterium]|tara:strand:+ start:8892 stop:9446 length:555 start_codon:yes stop_codon:yes gene_type:complete